MNAVAPGIIYSEQAAANYTGQHKGLLQSAAKRTPAKRVGVPEEVSAAVCFLLSPASSYTTGATLRVDGGSSLYTNMMDIPDHDSWPPPAHKAKL